MNTMQIKFCNKVKLDKANLHILIGENDRISSFWNTDSLKVITLQNQITQLQSEKNKPQNLPITAPTLNISQSIPAVVQDVPVITQVANNNKLFNYTELAKYIPAILLILNPFLQKQFGVQLVSEDLSVFLQFLGGLITTQLQAIKK